MNYYTYTFPAECPVDGDIVLYTLEVETESVISAEDLRDNCRRGMVMHEELADDLAKLMPGLQKLTATHRGVRILTVREQP